MNTDMTTITRAERCDLQQILDLQYLAYRSEAELLNDFRIPPLLQTLQELQAEFETGIVLKATDGCGRIVGSVRGHADGGTLFIGKLIVGQQQRGKGIGTELLGSIEKEYPPMRCELFTSHKSIKNLNLYRRLGYRPFREKEIYPGMRLVFLEKFSGTENDIPAGSIP